MQQIQFRRLAILAGGLSASESSWNKINHDRRSTSSVTTPPTRHRACAGRYFQACTGHYLKDLANIHYFHLTFYVNGGGVTA